MAAAQGSLRGTAVNTTSNATLESNGTQEADSWTLEQLLPALLGENSTLGDALAILRAANLTDNEALSLLPNANGSNVSLANQNLTDMVAWGAGGGWHAGHPWGPHGGAWHGGYHGPAHSGFCTARSAGWGCLGTTRVKCCRTSWGFSECGRVVGFHGCGRPLAPVPPYYPPPYVPPPVVVPQSFCVGRHEGWFCSGTTHVHCCRHGAIFASCSTVVGYHGCR